MKKLVLMTGLMDVAPSASFVGTAPDEAHRPPASLKQTNKIKILSIAIALGTLIAFGAVTQSLANEYWIIEDATGMPTVTDKQPADSVMGARGPFKYYDEAVRDMGTGTEWRMRCYISGQCTSARQLGK